MQDLNSKSASLKKGVCGVCVCEQFSETLNNDFVPEEQVAQDKARRARLQKLKELREAKLKLQRDLIAAGKEDEDELARIEAEERLNDPDASQDEDKDGDGAFMEFLLLPSVFTTILL